MAITFTETTYFIKIEQKKGTLMSKVVLFPNSNVIPSNFSHSLEKIDWKTTACASLILGTAGLIAYQMLYGRFFSRNTQHTFKNIQLDFSTRRMGTIISFVQTVSGEEPTGGTWTPAEVLRLNPQLVEWKFEEVVNSTLKILDDNNRTNSSEIILTKNNKNHEQFFKFLSLGTGGKYGKYNEANSKESWIYKILQQLREKNYIASFSIEADKIIIQKTLK